MKANLLGHFEGGSTKVKENHIYKDTGCKAARLLDYGGPCLECPFTRCLQELGSNWKVYGKQERNSEIIRRWKASESVKELALDFKLSKCTVQRAIHDSRYKPVSAP